MSHILSTDVWGEGAYQAGGVPPHFNADTHTNNTQTPCVQVLRVNGCLEKVVFEAAEWLQASWASRAAACLWHTCRERRFLADL